MIVRIFALLFFITMASCGGRGGLSSGAGPSPDIAQGPAELEQLIYDTTNTGEQRLRVEPNIQSPDDLLRYRELKIAQAAEILEMTKEQSEDRPYYPVVITMRRPVSLPQLNRLIRNYNPTTSQEVTKLLERNIKALPKTEIVKDVDMLVIDLVKFVSTSGGGQLSPETLSDPVGLARLEAKLAVREMEHNGVFNYQLIRGVTSISGGIHREHLMRLEGEPTVFLADIGPKELYEGEVTAALWGDIYDEVDQYANQ